MEPPDAALVQKLENWYDGVGSRSQTFVLKRSLSDLSSAISETEGEAEGEPLLGADIGDSGSVSAPPLPEADQEYLRALLGVGETALVHVVRKYHQLLRSKGLDSEADALSASIRASIAVAPAVDGDADGDAETQQKRYTLLTEGLRRYFSMFSRAWPPIPVQVVEFNNLCYTHPRALTLWSIWALVHGFLRPSKKGPTRHAIDSASGYLMPGSMTLVLGPIGAGKSTLMSLLSGRLRVARGELRYNKRPLDSLIAQRYAALGSQSDEHLGGLTIRETLQFARPFMNSVHTQNLRLDDEAARFLEEALEEGEDLLVQSRLGMLGLTRSADLPVAANTVSDDERHRLTASELLLGPNPVIFFDRVSRTFDGPASFRVLSTIQAYAQVRQVAVLCSLVWPTQDVFKLFDRVILLAQGKVIFHGAREEVAPYLCSLGYSKPRHMSIPEFVQDVASPGGAKYLPSTGRHLSPDEFGERVVPANPCLMDLVARRDVDRILQSPTARHVLWVKGPASSVLQGIALRTLPARHTDAPSSQRGPASGAQGEAASASAGRASAVSGSAGSEEGYVGVPSSSGRERGVSVLISECPSDKAQLQDSWVHWEVERTGVVHVGDEVVGLAVGWDAPMRFTSAVGGDLSPSELLLQLDGLRVTRKRIRLQLERTLHASDPMFSRQGNVYAAQLSKAFLLPPPHEIWLLAGRQMRLMVRNKFSLLARLFQVVFLAVFNGFNCFQMPSDPPTLANLNLRRAVVLTSLLSMTLNNIGQLPAFLAHKEVASKHVKMRLFRPSSFVLADFLVGIPFSCTEALLLTCLVYPISGMTFSDSGAHFFVFLGVMALVAVHGSALIRFIAHSTPTAARAAYLTLYIAPFFFLFAHFFIPGDVIRPYWAWAYRINPVQWAATMAMVNEFQSSQFATPCSEVKALECQVSPNATVGAAYLSLYAWNQQPYIWVVGPLVILAWTLIYLLATMLFLAGIFPPNLASLAAATCSWPFSCLRLGTRRQATPASPAPPAPGRQHSPSGPAGSGGASQGLPIRAQSGEHSRGGPQEPPRLGRGTGAGEGGHLSAVPEGVAAVHQSADPREGPMFSIGAEESLWEGPESLPGAKAAPVLSNGEAHAEHALLGEAAGQGQGWGFTHALLHDYGPAHGAEQRPRLKESAAGDAQGNACSEDASGASSSAPPSGRPGSHIRWAVHPRAPEEGVPPVPPTLAVGEELAGRVFKSFVPFQKVLLTWHNVSYEVFGDGFEGGRELIRGASGWVLPGELLAITGAPATGKTSLLNVLSGRKLVGRVKGRVLVNGEPQQGAAFIARTSYMERGEQYYPYLTVEESMLYRAALLMPRTTTLRARRKFVEEILELCQLTAVRKQVVVHLLFPSSPAAMAAAARPGKTAPRKGASSWASFTGGAPAANHTGTPHLPQAVSFAALPRHNQNLQPGSGSGTSGAGTVDLERRVVMAMEMAGNPSVLFLDQPFVGMDLPQMINFARILKQVTSACGRVVVVTSIVPPVHLLDAFDRVTLLRKGGDVVYFGPSGPMGATIMAYFESIPGSPSVPRDSNPLSFIEALMDDPAARLLPTSAAEAGRRRKGSGREGGSARALGGAAAPLDYALEYRISSLALANEQFLRRLRRLFHSWKELRRSERASSANPTHHPPPLLPTDPTKQGVAIASTPGSARTSCSPGTPQAEPTSFDASNVGEPTGRENPGGGEGKGGQREAVEMEEGRAGGGASSAQGRVQGNGEAGSGGKGDGLEPGEADVFGWRLEPLVYDPSSSPSYWRRLVLVNWMVQKVYWRNKGYTINRLLFCLVLGVILGTLFFRLPQDSLLGASAQAAMVFGAAVLGSLFNAGSAVTLLAQLIKSIRRERVSQQYFASLYNIAFSAAEVMYVSLNTLTIAGVSGVLSGIAVSSAAQFFAFWFSLLLISLAAAYLGLLLAVTFSDFRVASVLIPIITGVWIATAGYIVPYIQMQGFFQLFFWTNPYQYAINAMTVAAFYCDTSTAACAAGDAQGCPCPRLTDYNAGAYVWDFFRDSRSLRAHTPGLDWLFLVCFCIGCRLAALAALKLLKHNQSPTYK